MCKQKVKTTTYYIVRRTEVSGRVAKWEIDDLAGAQEWAEIVKNKTPGCRVTIAEVQSHELPEYDA